MGSEAELRSILAAIRSLLAAEPAVQAFHQEI